MAEAAPPVSRIEPISLGRLHASEAISLEGSPFGLNPLHARMKDGELLAARRSTDLADDDARVNVDRLCALLTSSSPLTPDASLFHGVSRIPPDTTVRFFRDRVEVEPRTRVLEQSSSDPIEAADEVWRLIVASVKRATRDTKLVAVATGGGVDSSGIFAAALAVCRGANRADAQAVALDFGGEGDDRPYLRDLERELGIVAVRVAPSQGAASLISILNSPTTPGWSWSAASDQAIFQAARDRGADTILTGLGGDDLLDGYPRALGDEFARGKLGTLFRAARLGPSDASPTQRVGKWILRPLAASMIPDRVLSERRRRALSSQRAWLGPAFRHFLAEQARTWRPSRFDSPAARFDQLAKATYLADAVEMNDETAARAGIRAVHPFLDTAVVGFVASLPPTLLLQGNRLRGLFRLAIRGAVPSRVRLRATKADFTNAWLETLSAAGGKEILHELATMRECANLGLVEPDIFRAEFSARERDPIMWTLLWPLLGIEGFLRARAHRA
jgi:asparagine synthase (glutamine-hydrolysing)